MGSSATRLDAFTDAAFAFAVTLLLIGGSKVPETVGDLLAAFRNIPAFAAGFALIVMFWHAHVRWRRLSDRSGGLSVLLTLGLVFLVLIYVYPLRMMTQLLSEFAWGRPSRVGPAERHLLTVLYGLGFAAMATLQAALFASARVRLPRDDVRRKEAGDEVAIASILAVSGVLSATLALLPRARDVAPWMYWAIPVAIWAHYFRRSRTWDAVDTRTGSPRSFG